MDANIRETVERDLQSAKKYTAERAARAARRVSVKRLAALSVLNMICRIYLERLIHINEDDDKEISAEIIELKKKIKSANFLESFNLMFPRKLEKRMLCERVGIKAEFLVDISKSMLG